MKSKSVPLIALLAALLVLASNATADPGNGNGKGQSKKATDPCAVFSAACDVAPLVLPGTTSEVSVDDALAATPGALVSTAAADTEGGASGTCWNHVEGIQWGYWPTQVTIWDSTYWCARSGTISYRSTTVTLDGSACNPGDSSTYRIGGGIGYAAVQHEDVGHWSCFSIPWIGGWSVMKWIDVYNDVSGIGGIYDHS